MNRKYLQIAVLMLSLLLGSSLVFSQVAAPKNLSAKPVDNNRILLAWDVAAGSEISYFKVYRSMGDSDMFNFVTTVPGDYQSYTDFGLLSNIKYAYYVVAVYGYDVSGKSNIVMVPAISSRNYVAFSSVPTTNTRVRTYYEYLPSATSTDLRSNLIYTLISSPADMIIDSTIGKIQWIPQAVGRYPITLSVRNVNDSNYLKYGIVSESKVQSTQKFVVYVANNIGNIQGIVLDENSNPLPGVSIRLYQKNNEEFTYDVRTNDFGKYKISQIASGEYYLYAKSPTEYYTSGWYPGVTKIEDAQTVIISENSTKTRDLTLRINTPTQATVEGIVKDTLGRGISNATVYVLESNNYINIGNDDKSLECFIGEITNGASYTKTTTDINGNYSVTVNKNKSYYFLCGSNAYLSSYYDKQSNLLFADKLFINSDKKNIDFVLLPEMNSPNRIDGKVVKSDDGNGVESRIILTKKMESSRGGGGGGRVPLRTMPIADYKIYRTNSQGEFVIESLDTSQYYIQAIPFGSYLPTYYSSKYANGTFKWSEADSVQVLGSVTGLVLKSTPSITDGLGILSGTVKTQTKENVGGAIVYAISGTKIVGYGITDSLGNFIIKGLRSGVYTLFVDRLDFVSSGSQTYIIDYFDPEVSNIILTVNSVVSSVKTDVEQPEFKPIKGYSLGQNYPNPFNPSTTIEYSLEQSGFVEIKVYDILGREVRTLIHENNIPGLYRVVFDGKGQASGMYYIMMKVYHNNQIVYLDKKKMLLIK